MLTNIDIGEEWERRDFFPFYDADSTKQHGHDTPRIAIALAEWARDAITKDLGELVEEWHNLVHSHNGPLRPEDVAMLHCADKLAERLGIKREQNVT